MSDDVWFAMPARVRKDGHQRDPYGDVTLVMIVPRDLLDAIRRRPAKKEDAA